MDSQQGAKSSLVQYSPAQDTKTYVVLDTLLYGFNVALHEHHLQKNMEGDTSEQRCWAGYTVREEVWRSHSPFESPLQQALALAFSLMGEQWVISPPPAVAAEVEAGQRQ